MRTTNEPMRPATNPRVTSGRRDHGAALRRLLACWITVAASGPAALAQSARPEVRQAREVSPPTPGEHALPGGMRLWHVEAEQVPMVSLLVHIPGGALFDPPEKAGLAALTASMLDEGAGSRDAIALADEIDFLGASLEVSADREGSTVTLIVLRKNLEPALDLLADVLMRPRLEEKEWSRVKELWLNDLIQARQIPTLVARRAGDRVFYGASHPYGRPVDGDEASVGSLELDDVKAFYRRHWRPDGAAVVSAGAISSAALAKLLAARLGGWKGEGDAPTVPALAAGPDANRPRLAVVNMPGLPQTVVRIIGPGLARTDPEYTPLLLVNVVFGGSFTSRLNANLRERNGYTYGAGSGFSRTRAPGAYLAQASVQTEVTGKALQEFFNEYAGMESRPISLDELVKARATLKQNVVEQLESLGGTTALFGGLAAFGLPASQAGAELEAIGAARPIDVQRTANRFVDWKRATVLLVGDLAAIGPQLEGLEALELGTPLVVDTSGARVGE